MKEYFLLFPGYTFDAWGYGRVKWVTLDQSIDQSLSCLPPHKHKRCSSGDVSIALGRGDQVYNTRAYEGGRLCIQEGEA